MIDLPAGTGRIGAMLIAGALLWTWAPPSPGAAAAESGPELEQTGGTSERLLRQRKLFPRSTYAWPYSAGPTYGDHLRADRRAPGLLHTPVGTFDLTAGPPELPEQLRTAPDLKRLGRQYFIVQLHPDLVTSGTTRALTATIEDHGGAVIRALPVSAVIARLTLAAHREIARTPGLTALFPYPAAFKLDPSIGQAPLSDPVKALSETYDLEIALFPGEDTALAAQAIEALGGTVLKSWPGQVRAELHRSKLAGLAALQAVFMVHEHHPVVLHTEEVTTTIQTGRYNQGATPYNDAGIDGSGGPIAGPQVLMVLDSGIQLDAADLSDTRELPGTPGPSHRKVLFYGTTTPFGGFGDDRGCDSAVRGGVTHGHVVAATALGNATRVDEATYGASVVATDAQGNSWSLDGVAPGALLVSYDGQLTPLVGNCGEDRVDGALDVGDLYYGDAGGSLA